MLRRKRDTARWVAGTWVFVGLLCLAFSQASALAGTPYVDGISDQNLPGWSGLFRTWFTNNWVNGPNGHIRFARYTPRWNALNSERSAFETWVSEAGAMGLRLDIAPTTFGGEPKPSAVEYRTELDAMLTQAEAMGHRIEFVEPWNEPNNEGRANVSQAVEYAVEAYSACSGRCTEIAGDFNDQSGFETYEKEYVEKVWAKISPNNWGIHPYLAVEQQRPNPEETTVWQFRKDLPNGGSGDSIWFTEVGAFNCNYKYETLGESQQAVDADYLVKDLMPWFGPEHVFYYEFDYKENKQPPCSSEEGADTALYLPPNGIEEAEVPAQPRPAASVIHDNKFGPWAYTKSIEESSVGKKNAEMRGAIYTGGFFNTEYFFEYGPNTGYGQASKVETVSSERGVHWGVWAGLGSYAKHDVPLQSSCA